MTKQFDTIRGFPILLSDPTPDGDLILVQYGDEYVVSTRRNPEDREWDEGQYFSFKKPTRTPQSRALAQALECYRDKLARVRGNDAAA